MGVIVVITVIGTTLLVVFAKNGQISADASEVTTVQSVSDISLTITDGVDQVKNGDVVNYQISLAYKGTQITNQADLDRATKAILQAAGASDSSKAKLYLVGYLGSAKLKVTQAMLDDKSLQVYEFPRLVGAEGWFVKYPNFEASLNQVLAGTNADLTMPVVINIPNTMSLKQPQIYGSVYAYLTYRDGLRNKQTVIAKAIDTDALVTSPTGGTTAQLTELQISPKSPVYITSESQVQFRAMANYSDGSLKEVTSDSQTTWKVTTTKKMGDVKSIGSISTTGLFTASHVVKAGITRIDLPTGKISVTFGDKTVETDTFAILPSEILQ
ncbi:hypothetical protein A2V71_03920 [Candidatus Berkelbacteria bacterium RBG_13_40_8]|uniref:Uncharacterized protein n=1 Tax=Candidatus Berkelbacteria bacterium RBG_13_40_8 TaxID=1797467 RepID=A0A1F5DLL7_9BACT|nr:MAG: hypothetical protein A2V71_03920 [Candidatus Berkelbacteria bacterium RBG_13_40_8]